MKYYPKYPINQGINSTHAHLCAMKLEQTLMAWNVFMGDILTKTITCQFHFYENMRKATHQKIKPDEQETFKNLMVALTKSATVEEYNR